jgi:NAD(P)H-dependent flavin oxidoreductase YrpB (nitropropane dioxygenase family)
MALRTRLTDLLGIDHPVVLGGMGSGATGHALVAAVSAAGGLGTLSASALNPAAQRAEVEAIRSRTDRPFGLNHLLCFVNEEFYAASLELHPRVIATAWAWSTQDIRKYFERAHQAGALVMHMVSGVPEAKRAVDAGADVIVAQGTEGGGHVGWMGSMALVPMVARAVAPVPVLARAGLPMVPDWRPRWRSEQRVCCSAPAFWRPTNRPCRTASSGPSSKATAMTRC